jgi:6-phospho-3-hexuloisomerase
MSVQQSGQSQPWLTVEQEIAHLLSRIDAQSFRNIVQTFENRDRRWFFSGQGRSGLVVEMAAMRFMHLGYDVHFVGEATAPSVRKGDGFLLVCGSGQTPISMGFAATAKAEGALLVVLTHKPQSELAGLADILLPVPAQRTAQFGGSLFEQCCLILLDSLALELTPREPDAHARMWRRHTNMQ